MKKYQLKEETSSSIVETKASYPAPSHPALKVILGSRADIGNAQDMDLVNLTREGVTRNVMYSVARYMGITLEEMAALLHTSYRNLVRKDGNDHLDPLKSNRIIELAKFAQYGVEVFESHENFKHWLRSKVMSLQFKTPLDYLDTTFGMNHLTNLLGRIQYGLY